MAQVATPTTVNERIGVLDALRGLALFGILLANITDWSAWGWLEFEEKVAIASPTVVRVTDFLNLMLINGKFYTIFSFLFGLGFALQLSRLELRGADGKAIYRRRLALLLMFGVLHMTFVWQGDILTLYAALGFLLPLSPWVVRSKIIDRSSNNTAHSNSRVCAGRGDRHPARPWIETANLLAGRQTVGGFRRG